jgi:hypothetical protein
MKRVLLALCLFATLTYGQGGNFSNPQSSLLHLLSNSSTTGPQLLWQGGIGAFSCVGAFGSATVTLEFQGPDGITMQQVGAATTLNSSSSPPNGVFYLYATLIQAVITGANATTSLTCSAGIVPAPNTA